VRKLDLRQLARYAGFGVFSACLTLGLPVLLRELAGLAAELAVAITYLIMLGVNFVAARRFIYRASGGLGRQGLRYLAVNASFRAIEYLAFLVLHTGFGVYYLFALVAVVGCSFVSKYFLYGRFVFGRR